MKLTFLCDNSTLTDVYLTGEPALSFYIEDCGKKILFDAGYSDVFIKNAEKLGIDLLSLDFIVLSHGHCDHTGGLEFLKKMFEEAEINGFSHKRPVLVAHPLVFRSIYEEGFGEIGSPLKKEDAKAFCELKLSRNPVRITENLVFLGEIRESCEFEEPHSAGVSVADSGEVLPDFQPDDSALVFSGKNGLCVITGCSHKGICSILKQAGKVSGRDDYFCVIGGFHLLEAEKERLYETGKFLGNAGISFIYPCHCTDFKAKAALSKFVEVKEAGCGLVLSTMAGKI
ncbi:7,8-dihydropterin-6-yl-methyl-4-(beta-D-ribofuranosyl)aminobenzene 5'-phosphate synthase [Methanomicrobium sp. W14]|uniref:MBL fold metallo-hydrolase n=1 Tax=Methanomicrobium sp. W14 TaxID=2817839 RepID=UPI001AE8429C|nr:MBL fold metallo-hydrolase [Methanomicrobium sp. W14]MBP2134279.1 7,8-dihydropterin-6-yl-methyl-4-(beta-D-ribofuranosyl)aminobenzene 5'-phosphate synthase [Methanomicrobium sp. W14]